MNTGDRHVEDLLGEALALPDAEARRLYLERACAGDAALCQEVESLLKAHEQATGFLEPAAGPALAHPALEQPGDRIGRYKLLEQIGEGGFGVVWMAEQEEPVRRRVALKIIKLGMDTKEVVARFEAERQALALMDHPNIASVFDGGATQAGRPYFVMELVKGVPITNYCDTTKLSTPERLELFMQVCQAVQHAHQKGIIHRDLKPSNILVTVKDDRPVPKVIDFGVAKATQARLTEKTLFTRLQQRIGTPAYMSPEQAGLGSLDVDTRSDVYALGVLLYELLTGHTPFDTQKLLEAGYDAVMRTIREEEPPKPSTRLSTLADEELSTVAAQRGAEPAKLGRLVRGDLDWIAMKALEKDRTRRYETASDFARDIERHLGSKPVSAAAPGVGYRVQKFIRRHRSRFAVAGLAAVILGLAAVGVKLGLKNQSSQKTLLAMGSNAVFTAAESGDVKALGRLLDSNPHLVHQRNASGATPLAYAAITGKTEAMRLLLIHDATVDALDEVGLTPLIYAAMKGHAAAAEVLLSAGANPNYTGPSGSTALQMAALGGSTNAGRALLARGARVDAVSQPDRLTALHLAASLGHADFVALLLDYGAHADPRDAAGSTPLHCAATGLNGFSMAHAWIGQETDHAVNNDQGSKPPSMLMRYSNQVASALASLPESFLNGGGQHRRAAEVLLAKGASLDVTNFAGCTPLWTAARGTNRAVAQVLLAHKARLDVRNLNGLTALHAAVQAEGLAMVALLLEAGADPNLPDSAGFTPLHTAVEHDLYAIVECLLAHRADPDLACPSSGETSVFMGQGPLHTAAIRGNLEMIRLLLDKGASLHPATGSDPPLSWAVMGGNPRAVALLLDRRAQPNMISSHRGMTALHRAAMCGQLECARLLLDRGASNNVISQFGTPLHLAATGREAAQEIAAPSIPGKGAAKSKAYRLPPSTDGDYAAMIKLLLDRGAEVNARELGYQATPLFRAVRAGYVTGVEILLAAGADVSACDSIGTTPLHAASESHASASAVSNIVVRLLKAGASPRARDDRRATPLHAAANGGRLEAAALLIAAGAGVNSAGPSLFTPLHIAVQKNNRPLTELLLAKGADPELRSEEGATALHYAVVIRSKELVALLLQHDAYVDAAGGDGSTALIGAAALGDLDIVNLLLAHQAKVDAVNQNGWTPFIAAAFGGRVEIAKLFLERGARSDVADRYGITPLIHAAKEGRLDMVKFLRTQGAKVEARNSEGFTALHEAADRGHAEVVEFLINQGASVHWRDNYDSTPLHLAAQTEFATPANCAAVARVLLAHGADLNALRGGSYTPLHRAAEKGHLQVMQVLLAAKADPDLRDAGGKTALDLAIAGKHTECADLLRGHRQVPSPDAMLQPSNQTTHPSAGKPKL